MKSPAENPSRRFERRIWLAIGVAVALVVALGALCLFALRSSVSLDREAFDRANEIVEFGRVRTALERKMNAFRSALEDPAGPALAEMTAAREEMRGILAEFERQSDRQERALLARIDAAERAHHDVLEEALSRRRSGETGDSIAVYLVRELGPRRQALEAAIDDFLRVERADMDKVARLSRRQSQLTTVFVAVMSVLAIALISVVGGATVRHLTQSFETELHQRQRAESAESRSRFLAEASEILGSSLDYRTTLSSVAALAVPRIADWCFIDMREEGEIRRMAVAHHRPEQAALAKELEQRHLLDPSADRGPARVLRTGEPEVLPEVSDDLLRTVSRTPEDFEVLRELKIRSALCVAIRTRGEVVGILTFAVTDAVRRYTHADLALGEELARRAGLAIDNARLYGDVQKAVALRDDFLSIASHELKTPLATLQLQIQGIARRMQDAAPHSLVKMQGRLATAQRQVERLGQLVHNLLDISRISSGHLDLDRERVNLETVVRDTLARFSEDLERSGCAVTVSINDDAPFGDWDRTRVEQIVTNLLSNASKYGAGRPIEVTLDGDSEAVRLAVRDHGIGIAPQDHERIFHRFERAVSVRHYGGLGLGLWIVRRIVEALGGHISVESRPGDGSLFTVELPRHPGADVRLEIRGEA